ncbi:hypothetical protein [Caudoviricetes sp.]|nr:hypothetical protein [Caudoviricetes sp.]
MASARLMARAMTTSKVGATASACIAHGSRARSCRFRAP